MCPSTPFFKIVLSLAAVGMLIPLASCARPSGTQTNAAKKPALEGIPTSEPTIEVVGDHDPTSSGSEILLLDERIEPKLNSRHSAEPTAIPNTPPDLEPIDVQFVEHGDRQRSLVALTFDLCQKPSNPSGFDEEIVDVLIQTQTPATFFLGGDWMRTHIDETRQLASVPYFELGNHSWSHPDFSELDELEMSREIMLTQSTLFKLTGRQSRLFRFPAGTYNALAMSVVAWHGLRSIQWDVVTADPVPDNTAEMINTSVREQVRNGSIIIMHANGRGWHTAEALPEMIDFLRAEDYCLVTVSQLLGLDPLPDECGEAHYASGSGHLLQMDLGSE